MNQRSEVKGHWSESRATAKGHWSGVTGQRSGVTGQSRIMDPDQ